MKDFEVDDVTSQIGTYCKIVYLYASFLTHLTELFALFYTGKYLLALPFPDNELGGIGEKSARQKAWTLLRSLH